MVRYQRLTREAQVEILLVVFKFMADDTLRKVELLPTRGLQLGKYNSLGKIGHQLMAIVTERINVESRTKHDAFAVDITLCRGFESHRLPTVYGNRGVEGLALNGHAVPTRLLNAIRYGLSGFPDLQST